MDQDATARSAIGRWHWLPLASVLLLAFCLRVALLAVAWDHSHDLASLHAADTHTYVEPAQSLLHSDSFFSPDGPELNRTPGYPLLLIPGIAIGHLEDLTVGLQMLLSVATVWLVYHLAMSLTGNRVVALAAGSFLAIEPLSITYTSYLMPETLFTFLLVLFIMALIAHFRTNSLTYLILGAGLLAAATFVRPISYYLPPIVALVVLARDFWQSAPRWRPFLCAGLFLAVSVIPLVSWQARNFVVADYRGFAGISDWNLYFYQGASVVAHERQQSLETAQAELETSCRELYPDLHGADQAAALRFMHREGVRLLSEHPAAYAFIHLRGLAQLILNPAASDMLRLIDRYPENQRKHHSIDTSILGIVAQMHREVPLVLYTNLVLAVGLGIAYAAAALGLVGNLPRWNWNFTLLILVIGYLLAIAGGPACTARLRQPAMPLICVLAGIGAGQFLRWRAGQRPSHDNQPHVRVVSPPKAKSRRSARSFAAPHCVP